MEWKTGDSTWFPEPRAVPLFWITQPETGKWHTPAIFNQRYFCAVQVSAAVAYYTNCIQDGAFLTTEWLPAWQEGLCILELIGKGFHEAEGTNKIIMFKFIIRE